jgi:transposase InsO family protein
LLRSQGHALLASDFLETVAVTGQRQYVLAVIEQVTLRIRVLGTVAQPTATWVTQAIKNLVMDVEDAGATVKFLIRDRDAKFPALIDEILTDAGIQTVLTGIRVPRMNSIMERWVQSCRHELLDPTLIWNEHHLRHALRKDEKFYDSHRAHQAKRQAAPLHPVPAPITDPDRIAHLNIRRHDRLGGVLHEYLHAAWVFGKAGVWRSPDAGHTPRLV